MKLVAYFSATGTTKRAAIDYARSLGANVWEIQPAVSYTSMDLNWNDPHSRTSLEAKDTSSRPEILGTCPLSGVDELYLAFPVWWYMAPRIIQTFLEKNDLSNISIHLLATSGGSTIEGSLAKLRKLYPHSSFVDGRMLS